VPCDLNTLLPLIVANRLDVLGAIAMLIIGLWLSGKAQARGEPDGPRSFAAIIRAVRRVVP
jgi:hypothetical protein